MGVEYAILNLGHSNSQPTGSVTAYTVLVPSLNVGALTLDATNPKLSNWYGKASEAIRFLTMFQPEQSAALPGGSPPAPFTAWDKYGLFLPWTAFEGRFLNVLTNHTSNNVGNTVNTVNVAGAVPEWAANGAVDKYVRFTSGAQSGQRRKITASASGATSSVSWATALPGVPAADDFSINDLAHRLTNPAVFAPAPVPALGVGFAYPNAFAIQGGPLFDETVEPTGQIVGAFGLSVSPAVDIGYRVQSWLKQRVNIINLGIGSALLSYTEQGIGLPQWGWYQPKLHTNWSPSDNNGLAARLREVLDVAKLAAQVEGNTLVVIGAYISLGQVDIPVASIFELFEKTANALVDFVEDECEARGLLEHGQKGLMTGWESVSETTPGIAAASAQALNAILQKMARDRVNFFTWPSTSFSKEADGVHNSALGCRQSAGAWFDGFLAARARMTLAVPTEDVPTLQELRDSVRRRVEGSTEDTSQDAAINDKLDEAINESYDEIIAEVGDSTWWLRQMLTGSFSFSPTTPVDLPRPVQRLLEIRDVSNPSRRFDFSMVGHSDQGRVRVITPNTYWSGAVELHHMIEPRRLTHAAERPVLPKGVYVEALIAGAAWRYARAPGNAQVKAELAAEKSRLMTQVSNHAAKVDRQRRERMRGNRGRGSRWGRGRGHWPVSGNFVDG